MMPEVVERGLAFVDQGGFVIYPLIVLTLVLWYALGYRWAILKRGNTRSVRMLVNRYREGYDREPKGVIDTAVVAALKISGLPHWDLRKCLDDAFIELRKTVDKYSGLVRAIVLVAPLLGLLGTVNGMIEMFDSLGDSTFYSQSGGIARGIAEALLTTEMGLVVAVPGLVAGRILDRRQHLMEREMNQIIDILSGQEGGASI